MEKAIEMDTTRARSARALDIIFNEVDDRLCDGKFDEVNEILQVVDIEDTSVRLLIGYLTITLAAHKKLPYRPTFFQRCKTEFEKRPESQNRINGLTQGLEGSS